jgi:hypothetical protein
MNYSSINVQEIEEFYNMSFPSTYKDILFLIGDKLTEFSRRQTRSISIQSKEKISIYDIQNHMLEWANECEINELLNSNIFFITTFLILTDRTSVSYFIKPNGGIDCSVYMWIIDNIDDDKDSIEKNSSSIEQWLCKINPLLYLEYKARKKLTIY